MTTYKILEVAIRNMPRDHSLTADKFIEDLGRIEGLHPARRYEMLCQFGEFRPVAQEYLDLHPARRFQFLGRLRRNWELAQVMNGQYRKAG